MENLQSGMPDTHLLTRKQIAFMFGIKPMSIWHWERKNLLKPALYVNGRPRYTLADVQKIFTDRQTVDFRPKKKRHDQAEKKPVATGSLNTIS
jgi:hypothetical protein